jgi:tRNA dimethylallyltransferase
MSEFRHYFLTGCTAAGKTSVAHHLAKQKGYAILSTDSMQIYQDMNIGTAKATEQELNEVEYYGIDICPPTENYSLWDFCQYSKKIFKENSKKTFIITGGTGLYIKALTQGLNELPSADEELRTCWNSIIEKDGISPIQNELEKLASNYFLNMTKDDQENPRRLIRALELVTSPQYQANPAAWTKTKEKINLIGVTMPTDELNKKIAKRVYQMYDAGLIDEVKNILKKHKLFNKTAAQAIGYAEAIAFIENRYSKDEAIEKTIVRTRRLAKKQRTWFRHQANMDWVDTTCLTLEQTADIILQKWSLHGRTAIK